MSEESQKRIEDFLKSARKEFGNESVITAKDKKVKVDVISTGSVKIDIATGIGGIPRGRITEVFGMESSGKTTLALHAVANCQKAGMSALYVDVEHALDPKYAKNLGIDMDSLLISQPDNGEQALDIIKFGLNSKAFGLIVLDSVASLVPRVVFEGDMADSNVGVLARLMSKACPLFVDLASDANTALLMINQIRSSIGQCFQYNTMVLMADGSVQPIGKIVNQKIKADVMTFDPVTMEVKSAPITGWHKNGRAGSFLHIKTDRPWGTNGASGFKCTEDHQIFTPDGFVPAKALSVGDFVMSLSEEKLSAIQMQVAIGSVLGDGSLRQTKSGRANFRVLHGKDQVEYCKWKQSLFSNLSVSSSERKGGGWSFETESLWDLASLRRESYEGGRRKLPCLDGFTKLSMAIWCMDDGSYTRTKTMKGKGKFALACKWLSEEEKNRVADKIESMGIPRPTVLKRILQWSGESCYAMQKELARHWHPSMNYKLHPSLHGLFEEPGNVFVPAKNVLVPTKINKVSKVSGLKSMEMFDLTVDGTHTYMASGICVHNSYGDPTVTSGGKALKFYASVRIQTFRSTLQKDGELVVGNTVKAKVIKNKLAPPFRDCETEIVYGEGFSRESDLLDLGQENGFIEKSGAWYVVNGEKIQGKDRAVQYLLANPDYCTQLESQVIATLG